MSKSPSWTHSNESWPVLKSLLPERRPNARPLGCHRRRAHDRAAMTAILFVLRMGCHWNVLNVLRICSRSSAHRRVVEWVEACISERFWRQGLLAHDEFEGIDWLWQSMGLRDDEGAAYGLKKTRANPADRGKQGIKRCLMTETLAFPSQ